MSDAMIDRVYGAKTLDEQKATYDAWSAQYERDLCAMGYRLPAVAAAVFTRYVPVDTTPILDAGCGGGLQTEPLVVLGYGPIVGIDLSAGMLAVAREKGIYSDLYQMALGKQLEFPDESFAAILSMGTLTPGHAPAESFEGLIRIARRKALIIFSLRSDPGQDPKYPETCARLEADKCWRHVASTAEFVTMPYGEPDIKTRVHVYQVL